MTPEQERRAFEACCKGTLIGFLLIFILMVVMGVIAYWNK